MDGEPEITRRAAQPYAGISAWVPMAAVGSVADRIPEIFGWLGADRGRRRDPRRAAARRPCRLEFYLTDPAGQPDTSKWQTQLAFRLAD